MKLEALDHPKTMDLAARLNVEMPTAIGYLELLWAFTGKKSPQGNIGKWPDGAIARACYWMGPPQVFIQALTESGFLDADDDFRLIVHDWHEHAPRWVKSKLSTLKLAFISVDTSEDTGGDTGGDSKGREGKASEDKGDALALPDGLSLQAWERWLAYRIEIRKPLKQASIPAAQLALAAFGTSQSAVVEQSIANGWQGLFPLKTVNGKQPEDPQAKDRDALRKLAERRTAIGLADFREPNPGETADQYRKAQDAEWSSRKRRPLGDVMAGALKVMQS